MSIYRCVSEEELNEAKKQFSRDLRDSATPGAMTSLLTKLFRREILNVENTEWMLNTMRRKSYIQTG